MNYQKQNFRSGQKLYASQLNGMDDMILELVEELQKTKSLSIGSVQTGESASATITRRETGALQLNIVLPRGERGAQGPKGDPGERGAQGPAGTTPTLEIGTVTTGAKAAAAIQNGKLNLVLPVTSVSGGTGDGITDAAKSYILALFENAAYTNSTMLATCNALKSGVGHGVRYHGHPQPA